MELIDRKEARALGLKFYFTGKKCKRGHIVRRLTTNANCHTCFLFISNKARNRNRESIRIRDREKYRKAPSKKITNAKIWANKNKKKRVEITEKYRKKNAQYYAAYSANRRVNKLLATPKWADLEKIIEIYKNCPQEMEVDHVIPLKGKLVCGLHVENNLQYLSRQENATKHNKFICQK